MSENGSGINEIKPMYHPEAKFQRKMKINFPGTAVESSGLNTDSQKKDDENSRSENRDVVIMKLEQMIQDKNADPKMKEMAEEYITQQRDKLKAVSHPEAKYLSKIKIKTPDNK